MTVTLPYAETFPGAAAAAWPSAAWTVKTGTAQQMGDGRGRITTTGTSFAARVDGLGIPAQTDTDIVYRVSNDGTVGSQNTVINSDVPAANITTGTGRPPNCYYCTLVWQSSEFRIGKTIAGVTTQLGVASYTFLANTYYWVRLQRLGTTLRAKLWPDGTTEPTTWTLSATLTGTTLGSGLVALNGTTFTDGVTRNFDFRDVTVSTPVTPPASTTPLPYTDTFTGSNGAALANVWTTAVGSAVISGNRARLTSGTTLNASARVDGTGLAPSDNTDIVFTVANDLPGDGSVNVCVNGDGGKTLAAIKSRQDDCYYVTVAWSSQQLRIGANDDGVTTQYAAKSVTLVAGQDYRVRLQRAGQILRARIWDPSVTEPTTWDLTYTITGTPKFGIVSLARAFTGNGTSSVLSDFDDVTVSSPATPVATASLLSRVVGVPTSTSARVATRTNGATSVRLRVGDDTAVSQNVTYGAPVTPNAQGDAQLEVTGLDPTKRAYYYRVEMTDVNGLVSDDGGVVGKFRTRPNGATSFAFCFGSCVKDTDPLSMSAMAARDDDLFLHLGDLYYADASGTGVGNFRTKIATKLQAPNHVKLLSGTPSVYTPSDHDGMNNASTGAGDPAAWLNWNQAYREQWPADPSIPASTGVYFTFTWGRVRFIVLDGSSFKSVPTAADDAAKTFIGATQKQWLKDTVTAATEPLIVIAQPAPWTGAAVAGADDWTGYTTERTELASFFDASGKKIVMLGGDMHALAAVSSASAPGHVTQLQAAPFGNTSSNKSGPYTVGPYPSTTGTAVQQYGRVVVTDDGSLLTATFTGYSADGTQRVTLSTSVQTGGGDVKVNGTPHPVKVNGVKHAVKVNGVQTPY